MSTRIHNRRSAHTKLAIEHPGTQGFYTHRDDAGTGTCPSSADADRNPHRSGETWTLITVAKILRSGQCAVEVTVRCGLAASTSGSVRASEDDDGVRCGVQDGCSASDWVAVDPEDGTRRGMVGGELRILGVLRLRALQEGRDHVLFTPSGRKREAVVARVGIVPPAGSCRCLR